MKRLLCDTIPDLNERARCIADAMAAYSECVDNCRSGGCNSAPWSC